MKARTLAPISVSVAEVLDGEPCYGLYEGPSLLTKWDGSSEWRWCQDVTVIRNDARAHHLVDMGPAADYEYVTPIYLPCFGDESVAALRYHADKNREDHYWQKRAKELEESSTLITDALRQLEQEREEVHNRTSIGPHVSVQRNRHSRQNASRKLMEKVDEYHGTGPWNRMNRGKT